MGMKEEDAALEASAEDHAALAETNAKVGVTWAGTESSCEVGKDEDSTAKLAEVHQVHELDLEQVPRPLVGFPNCSALGPAPRASITREALKGTSVKLPFGRVVGRSLEKVNEFLGIPSAARPRDATLLQVCDAAPSVRGAEGLGRRLRRRSRRRDKADAMPARTAVQAQTREPGWSAPC